MKTFMHLAMACMISVMTVHAQTFNDEVDLRNKVFSSKEQKIAFIESQRQLKRQPLDQKHLKDSSLYYSWNTTSQSWSVNPYRKSTTVYNTQGLVTYTRYYNWLEAANKWGNDYEIHYIWDTHGNLTVWIYNEFDEGSNTWVPYEHDTLLYNNNILISESWNFYNKPLNKWLKGYSWQYNNNGTLLESYYYFWNDLTFEIEDGNKAIYSLNTNDLPIEKIDQRFDAAALLWINSTKTVSTYQNNITLINELISDWDPQGVQWTPSYQYQYSYTNNLKTQAIIQVLLGTEWTTFSRTLYEYNSNELITKQLYQNINETEWVNHNQILYTYNPNNLMTESLAQLFINNNWANSTLYGYTYDNNGNSIERFYKRWDMNTGLLTANSYKYTYTYDNNNLNIHNVYQRWDVVNVGWLNNYQVDNYYSLHEVFGLPFHERNSLVTLYPNPATKMLYWTGVTGKSTISVVDINGQLMSSLQHGNGQVDVSNLRSGCYTLKIETSQGVVTKKFIRQ